MQTMMQFGMEFASFCHKDLNSRASGAVPALGSESSAAFRAFEVRVHERILREPADSWGKGGHLIQKLIASFFIAATHYPYEQDLEPSVLASSWGIRVITRELEDVCSRVPGARAALKTGGALLATAITAMFTEDVPKPDNPKRVSLLEWFGDEVCGKLWGVADAWGESRAKEPAGGLLQSAATVGRTDVARLIVSKGCRNAVGDTRGPVKSSPLAVAADNGFFGTFEYLLSLVAPGDLCKLFSDKWCVAGRLFFAEPPDNLYPRPSFDEDKHKILDLVLRTRPEVYNALCMIHNEQVLDTLQMAIFSQDVRVVEAVMASGKASIKTKHEKRRLPDGTRGTLTPTIAFATNNGGYEVFELLVCKYGALDRFNERYDELAREAVAVELSIAAVCSFPTLPGFNGFTERQKPAPEGMKILDLAISRGFKHSFQLNDMNDILCRLYPADADGCRLNEADCLTVLRRYHDAGMNVSSMTKRAFTAGDWSDGLAMSAAACGQKRVVDFAVEECGCRVDFKHSFGLGVSHTPLCLALVTGHYDTALHLLSKYKAQAAYRDLSVFAQPLSQMLSLIGAQVDTRTDKFFEVVKALGERDSELLTIPAYSGNSPEDDLSTTMGQPSPIVACAMIGNSRVMQYLLGLPGGRDMAARPSKIPDMRRGAAPSSSASAWPTAMVRANAAQVCAARGFWDCLSLLMEQSDVRLSDTYASTGLGKAATSLGSLPSAAEAVLKATARADPPPRALVAAVLARVKAEKEAASAVTAAPATTYASNAFEDPSMSAVAAVSALGATKKEKKKAKKRAQRRLKKSNAQKQGAASSGADTDSSDGEEEPFDEPDDNLVDSRNAPSLDAMFAAMGLPPGGGTAPDAGEPKKV